MKKIRLIALLLVLSLLLGGCSMWDSLLLELQGYTAFSDIAYSRPDLAALEEAQEQVQKRLLNGSDAEQLMDAVFGVYELYHDFNTNHALAQIYYSRDLTDIYWEKEYSYCLESSSAVTALMENMLYALAACPLVEELEREEYFGADFFDAYQGENIWTDSFVALMEEESRLIGRYYELQEESSAAEYLSQEYFEVYGTQMAQLYVQLVALRQKIAREAGYGSYADFAYDYYYCRDYTPEQAFAFTEQIGQQLSPIYRRVAYSDVWEDFTRGSTEEETFEYVRQCAEAMGGTVWQAFELLQKAGLYDIRYSENKYPASFEMFLWDYYEPYVFLCPDNTVGDQLTFAHEFGHFCSDYAACGSIAGVDVAEIFSQGMEFLSLTYAPEGEQLRRMKMADALCVYVEQAAYAWFEEQVYRLEGEELSVEAVERLHRQMGEKFGFTVWNWDPRSYVCISHFFTNPYYVISYVVSNDAALQIYQLEQEQQGAGLEILQQQLATQEQYFLAFLESAGLESPFEPGRIGQLKTLFEEQLLKNKGAAGTLILIGRSCCPSGCAGR